MWVDNIEVPVKKIEITEYSFFYPVTCLICDQNNISNWSYHMAINILLYSFNTTYCPAVRYWNVCYKPNWNFIFSLLEVVLSPFQYYVFLFIHICTHSMRNFFLMNEMKLKRNFDWVVSCMKFAYLISL